MIKLIKEKTLAVTGHRKLSPDLDIYRLEEIFLSQIEKGIDTFLVGMAVGFDAICFQILEKIRDKKDIKIVACIPCKNQSKNFSIEQKEEYIRQVNSANEKILISREYTPYCMMKRNMFMVDNACTLVCFLRENKGGTFNTVNYAKQKGIEIIKI